MKKSSFIAMVLSTIGGILLALGMCMCLLPEWDAFKPGVIMGSVGLLVLLMMVIIWRGMENKTPIHISGRAIGITLLGIVGAILLGIGMCMSIVWNSLAPGIIVGIIGIIALLALIPAIKGLA